MWHKPLLSGGMLTYAAQFVVLKDDSAAIIINPLLRCKAKGSFVGRFQVRLTHMRVCMYLGTYDTIEEAVKIRDEAALKLHGEFATTGE